MPPTGDRARRAGAGPVRDRDLDRAHAPSQRSECTKIADAVAEDVHVQVGGSTRGWCQGHRFHRMAALDERVTEVVREDLRAATIGVGDDVQDAHGRRLVIAAFR
jgi:hypothetical protein